MRMLAQYEHKTFKVVTLHSGVQKGVLCWFYIGNLQAFLQTMTGSPINKFISDDKKFKKSCKSILFSFLKDEVTRVEK